VWTAKKEPEPNNFTPLPYEQLKGTLLGINYQLIGKWLLSFFGWMSWAIHRKSFFRKTWIGKWIVGIFRNSLVPGALGLLIRDGKTEFKDVWYNGIPMDNCIDERLIPVWLSELWFPIEQGTQVIREFRNYFETHDGPGTFSYEIYPAKKTEFWLSPGYDRDSFRVDIFWFAGNPEDPIKDFYQEFWVNLRKYHFRPHWGKFMPDLSQKDLEGLYPKYQHWKVFRKKYDPEDVFLNDYWKTRLKI
jgi:hypothetical protein